MHSIQSYCEVVVVVVSAAAVRPRSSTIRHFIDILHAFHLEMRVRFAMNAIFHSPLIIALQRELRVAPLLGVNRWYARCDRVALIVKYVIFIGGASHRLDMSCGQTQCCDSVHPHLCQVGYNNGPSTVIVERESKDAQKN